ncbi:hypothetical protein POJ06DRAFT_107969 [Lipomyces tetrasporus]|uniref:PH domain-containing protein n=1 Tax=Lipomyces tetrasporus TaxID=54092 RepID=A0AAD7VTW8_9ASCO|nr:uncharacterized protein POJ06DRAFT_107969 [Lipomyces tetrasporus]KAJ8100600.1 hypothetical protein POJ06DRAFT_107969 [Lipomyces tetrasporus]
MNIPTRYRSLRRKKAAPEATPVPPVNSSGQAPEPVAIGPNRDRVTVLPIQVLDPDTVVSCSIPSTMTASALISMVQRHSGKLPYRIESLRVAEIFNNCLQRELLGFELVSDIIKGWDALKENRLCIVLSNSPSSAMTVEAALPEYAPPVAGWLTIKLKSHKWSWSKRWAFTEDNTLYISKKPNPRLKDRIFLCNLNQVNFYDLQPQHLARIGSPSDLCFALKSPESHAIFEDHNDFMHYIACDDRPSFDMWKYAMETTRAIYVQKIAKLRLESFAQSETLDRQALVAPLIAPEEFAKPIDQHRLSIEKDSKTLIRSISARRPRPGLPAQQHHGPTIVAPTPEHLTVTKDSLLDRLLQGESVATTSITHYDNYDPIPPRRASGEDSRQESSSFAKKMTDSSGDSLDTASGVRRNGNIMPRTIDTSAKHNPQHRILASPTSSSTSESSNYFSASDSEAPALRRNHFRPVLQDHARRKSPLRTQLVDSTLQVKDEEQDDENTPLYKRLQQLDIKVGSKNPFLDPEIMTRPRLEQKSSTASLHAVLAQNDAGDNSIARSENAVKLSDGYTATSRSSGELVNQALQNLPRSPRLEILRDDHTRLRGHSLDSKRTRGNYLEENGHSHDRYAGAIRQREKSYKSNLRRHQSQIRQNDHSERRREDESNLPSNSHTVRRHKSSDLIITRNKTVREGSGANTRRNLSVRGPSSRLAFGVAEPLISVENEDKTLFHEGSLLAKMGSSRRY